jgi:transposase
VIADKGYDAASNRASARRRGAVPIIPYRKNTKVKPRFFPKRLYKLRARVEQFIGKLKRFKRVAMRCEKTATNFAAFVALACVFVLVKSVHRA